MRALTLTLAFALPIGLVACNAEPEQTELGEDIQEEVEGPIEEEVQQELGVQTDVYGGYDVDADNRISEAEWTEAGLVGDFVSYDTDGDGFIDETEYVAYQSTLEM